MRPALPCDRLGGLRNDRSRVTEVQPGQAARARCRAGQGLRPREGAPCRTPALLPSSGGRVRGGRGERAGDGQTGLRVDCGEIEIVVKLVTCICTKWGKWHG